MKLFFYISLIVALAIVSSCSQQPNIEKIQVSIPQELTNNAELVNFINSYIEIANDFNLISNDLIKTMGDKNIENESELSNIQKLKVAKVAIQMAALSSKIEEHQAQQKLISQKLTPSELVVFESICKSIEKQMVQIDRSSINLSDDELIAQQKVNEEKEAETNRLREEWEKAQAELPQEQRIPNQTPANNTTDQEFKFWHLLFPFVVLILLVVFAINKLKQLKNRAVNTVNDIKNIKTTAKSHINHSKQIVKDNEDEMTKEQKEGITKIFDALDNI